MNIGRPKKNCKIRARIPPRYKLTKFDFKSTQRKKSRSSRERDFYTRRRAQKRAHFFARVRKRRDSFFRVTSSPKRGKKKREGCRLNLNPKVTSKKIRDGESRVRAIVFSAAFRSFRGVKKLPRSFLPPVLADFYPRRATRAGPIFREPIFFFLRERERERAGREKREFVRNENTCLGDEGRRFDF